MSDKIQDPAEPDRQVIDCIERAEQRAKGDDRAFVRYLNECYAMAVSTRRLRSIPIAAAQVDRTPKSLQLLSDPRYLKNVRELARRTRGGKRIVGGTPVAKKDFLDCVAVGSDNAWGCTGTLIAPDVVVTAGHCENCATRVFFGNDVTRNGRIVSVKSRSRHPDYGPDGRNDLLILILAERVENIAPRKIADKAIVDSATDGRVVGFGNTDPHGMEGYGIKRQVDIAIASPSCEGALEGVADSERYRCFAGLEFVAGKPLLAKDSCTGDSGGPFYVAGSGGEWLIAGATSRATNASANDCGDGGIYVRVERYLSWIRQLPGVALPQ